MLGPAERVCQVMRQSAESMRQAIPASSTWQSAIYKRLAVAVKGAGRRVDAYLPRSSICILAVMPGRR